VLDLCRKGNQMNERIEKLIDDAKLTAVSEMFEDNLAKFAELIVRECIKEIGYKSAELLDIDFYTHYQERLKKHFGVEE
jgi:hypothetical protein